MTETATDNAKPAGPQDGVVSWGKPQPVDNLTVAFPAHVIGTLLPPRDAIPKEFWSFRNKWSELAAKLFFQGGKLPPAQPGIEPAYAKRHLQAVLGSYEPQHEHKMAGAAYLMSMWYRSS